MTASLRVALAGIPEEDVARRVRRLSPLRELSPRISGCHGLVDVRLSPPGRAEAEGEREEGGQGEKDAAERLRRGTEALRSAFGESVYEVGDRTLPEVVLEALRERGETLAVAESCTGGGLGRALTEVPGSSTVFWGGVVAYADDAKRRLLDVSAETLERHGAVSGETAREMARAVRERAGTDWGVSITGIAGPGGGSPEKPVGTVWICVAGSDSDLRRHRFDGDRHEVRERSVVAALDGLRRRAMTAR